jgi:rhomboid protease GluP
MNSDTQTTFNVQSNNISQEATNRLKQCLRYFKTFSFIIAIVTILVYILAIVLNILTWEDWNKTLLKLGAKYTPFIRKNFELHRLIAPIFLHYNIYHLLLNCLYLIIFGIFIEHMVTRKFTMLTYFISGLIATTLSAVLAPTTVSLGASGALYGNHLA